MPPNAMAKVSLVTGASRGIGAATAVNLASLGSDVIVNYRSKAPRAEKVVAAIESLGRRALSVQADVTNAEDVDRLVQEIGRSFGRLDCLVLNASGGLEKDKGDDYAMRLNRDAQLNLLQRSAQLLRTGARVVFVTSHWAHFYGRAPVISGYESVASSKHAGEQALRAYITERRDLALSLVVVSGDMIAGTITPRLLERSHPGVMETRKEEAGVLPTVEEFAAVIAQAAFDETLPSGHTIFVPPPENGSNCG